MSRLRDNFICDLCLDIDTLLQKKFESLQQKILLESDNQTQLLTTYSRKLENFSKAFTDLYHKLEEDQPHQFQASIIPESCKQTLLACSDKILLSVESRIKAFDDAVKVDTAKHDCLIKDVKLKLSDLTNSIKLNSNLIKDKHDFPVPTATQLLNPVNLTQVNLYKTDSSSQTNDEDLRCNLPSILQFGTQWTELEWRRRLNIIQSNSSKTATNKVKNLVKFHIKWPAGIMTSRKLLDFLFLKFNIRGVNCIDVTSKYINRRSLRFNSYLIEIPANFSSLLLDDNNKTIWTSLGATINYSKDHEVVSKTGKNAQKINQFNNKFHKLSKPNKSALKKNRYNQAISKSNSNTNFNNKKEFVNQKSKSNIKNNHVINKNILFCFSSWVYRSFVENET